jgi:hypothetical protein
MLFWHVVESLLLTSMLPLPADHGRSRGRRIPIEIHNLVHNHDGSTRKPELTNRRSALRYGLRSIRGTVVAERTRRGRPEKGLGLSLRTFHEQCRMPALALLRERRRGRVCSEGPGNRTRESPDAEPELAGSR